MVGCSGPTAAWSDAARRQRQKSALPYASRVHILSEDGSFGVRLTPVLSRTYVAFQLGAGDQVLGDGEPAIDGSSVSTLSELRPVDDPRLDPDRNNPTAILDWLTSDDWPDVHGEPNLYDLTLVEWGEAMDT